MYGLANWWQPVQQWQQSLQHLAFYAAWLVQVHGSAHTLHRHNPEFAVSIAEAVEFLSAGKVNYFIKRGHNIGFYPSVLTDSSPTEEQLFVVFFNSPS